MKTMFRLMSTIALIITIFGAHGTALAASTIRFKDKGADAFFSSSDGCLSTEAFILTGKEIYHSPPGPASNTTSAVVYLTQYDTCTGALRLAASGFAWLPASAFQISRDLTTASVNATVNVYDEVSGTSLDVTVNLQWTATSPLLRQNTIQHFHSPGCNENIRNSSTYRLAQASGSISNAVNYTPEPSLSASIFNSKNGYVSAGCDSV